MEFRSRSTCTAADSLAVSFVSQRNSFIGLLLLLVTVRSLLFIHFFLRTCQNTLTWTQVHTFVSTPFTLWLIRKHPCTDAVTCFQAAMVTGWSCIYWHTDHLTDHKQEIDLYINNSLAVGFMLKSLITIGCGLVCFAFTAVRDGTDPRAETVSSRWFNWHHSSLSVQF